MGLSIPKKEIFFLDINKETSQTAINFFKKANLTIIKIILGPAIETFRKLKNDKKVFDMIFIDADKEL